MPNLQKLSHEQQISVLTTPFFVPATENPQLESAAQGEKICETFSRLLRNIKYKLSLPDVSQKIQLIGQKYGFELLRLANITRLIREYYFGEVRFENFPAEIEKRMGVSLLTAQEITRYLKQEIIDWDPWAEYIAKLPKMPIRDIIQQYPKIAETEITAGYIELQGSEDLEDPTIKNWLKDYISHLGYDRHSQMDRTQYIFHSENGKNLSSQDREKLGIILKSFDENIPLPVDEENGEIVFDIDQGTMINDQITANAPWPQQAPSTQEPFIKPYLPVSQVQKQSPLISARPREINYTEPIPRPPKNTPQPLSLRPVSPQKNIHPNLVSQPNLQANSKIDKYFSAPESPEIPSIKIHSITEHNEPKITPQVPPRSTIQRPAKTSPQPSPYQGEGVARPKYKIIDPFFSKPRPEPRIDGNVVDLSDKTE